MDAKRNGRIRRSLTNVVGTENTCSCFFMFKEKDVACLSPFVKNTNTKQTPNEYISASYPHLFILICTNGHESDKTDFDPGHFS